MKYAISQIEFGVPLNLNRQDFLIALKDPAMLKQYCKTVDCLAFFGSNPIEMSITGGVCKFAVPPQKVEEENKVRIGIEMLQIGRAQRPIFDWLELSESQNATMILEFGTTDNINYFLSGLSFARVPVFNAHASTDYMSVTGTNTYGIKNAAAWEAIIKMANAAVKDNLYFTELMPSLDCLKNRFAEPEIIELMNDEELMNGICGRLSEELTKLLRKDVILEPKCDNTTPVFFQIGQETPVNILDAASKESFLILLLLYLELKKQIETDIQLMTLHNVESFIGIDIFPGVYKMIKKKGIQFFGTSKSAIVAKSVFTNGGPILK